MHEHPPGLSKLTGPVGQLVRHRRHELVTAAAAHDVTNLRVFGSVARGEDNADSDVDLLVDLPPGMGLRAAAVAGPNGVTSPSVTGQAILAGREELSLDTLGHDLPEPELR